MWQYLVVSKGWTLWKEDRRRDMGWFLPAEAPTIEPDASLQQGCAVLGRHGWELVAVTFERADTESFVREEHTLFFKKPEQAARR